jgi:hypothetical protein
MSKCRIVLQLQSRIMNRIDPSIHTSGKIIMETQKNYGSAVSLIARLMNGPSTAAQGPFRLPLRDRFDCRSGTVSTAAQGPFRLPLRNRFECRSGTRFDCRSGTDHKEYHLDTAYTTGSKIKC